MNNEWQTPDHIFEIFDREYQFDLDAAANESNAKCKKWFGRGGVAEDALKVDDWWNYGERVWCNPPFQEPQQSQFLAHITNQVLTAHQRGESLTIVTIIPATPETSRWEESVSKGSELIFLVPRVAYVDPASQKEKAGARWGSAVVVFDAGITEQEYPIQTRWLRWRD